MKQGKEVSMSTFRNLWLKLSRSKRYRDEFVKAHAKQAIPFQIRALMKQFGLSQAELAKRSGLTQGAISRAADPDYGNLTINTLVRIASGFDVAFVGRFVPFSDLPPWFDSVAERTFKVPSFTQEAAAMQPQTAGALPVLPTITRAEAEAKLVAWGKRIGKDDKDGMGDADWGYWRQALLTALFGVASPAKDRP